MKLLLSLVCISAFLPLVEGQISVVDSGAAGNQINLGSTYTQSFDSLANSTTAPVPWTNNATLPGWSAYQESKTLNFYAPSQGGRPDLGSFGTLGNTDRALGSGVALTFGDLVHFGVQFLNGSASTITGMDISFDGEQWFYGSNFGSVVESLGFSYQIFDAGQGSLSVATGWITVDDLKFVSPINSGATNRALDGNLSANREEGIADSITGMTLAPGQELWLRWTATNEDLISDHSLAIDNLSVLFTAVPEPETCAAFAGLIGLVAVARRRRRG